MMLPARLAALEAAYRHIAATRMADVPIVNPALRVQAVGFELLADEPAIALGVLVTPWCMNLLRLPITPTDTLLAPGTTGSRDIGTHAIDFVGGQLDSIGRFEQCSLFSPMAEFADQATAVATAVEVLKVLRPVAPPAAKPDPAASRRGFLFGRAAAQP